MNDLIKRLKVAGEALVQLSDKVNTKKGELADIYETIGNMYIIISHILDGDAESAGEMVHDEYFIIDTSYDVDETRKSLISDEWTEDFGYWLNDGRHNFPFGDVIFNIPLSDIQIKFTDFNNCKYEIVGGIV